MNMNILAPSPKRKREPLAQKQQVLSETCSAMRYTTTTSHTTPFTSASSARGLHPRGISTTSRNDASIPIRSPIPASRGSAFQFTSFPASLPRVCLRNELDVDTDGDTGTVHKRRPLTVSRSMDDTMETTMCNTSHASASASASMSMSTSVKFPCELNISSDVDVDSSMDQYHDHLLQHLHYTSRSSPSVRRYSGTSTTSSLRSPRRLQSQALYYTHNRGGMTQMHNHLHMTFSQDSTSNSMQEEEEDLAHCQDHATTTGHIHMNHMMHPPTTPTVRLNFNTLYSPTKHQHNHRHRDHDEHDNNSHSSSEEQGKGVHSAFRTLQHPIIVPTENIRSSMSHDLQCESVDSANVSGSVRICDLQKISAQCSPILNTEVGRGVDVDSPIPDSTSQHQHANHNHTNNNSSDVTLFISSSHNNDSGGTQTEMQNDNVHHTAKQRPMPDMNAFDSSTTTHNTYSNIQNNGTPRRIFCPPTPIKTPVKSPALSTVYSGSTKNTFRCTLGYHGPYLGSMSVGSIGESASTGSASYGAECVLEDEQEDSLPQQQDVVFKPVYRTSHDTTLAHTQQEQHSFASSYQNLGLIGSGAFADVYKCLCHDDNTVYAIKRNRRQCRKKKERDRMLSEVRTLQRLNVAFDHKSSIAVDMKEDASNTNTKCSESQTVCPNVLKFYTAWQEEGYIYTQTELCSTHTCGHLLSSLRMDYSTAMLRYDCIRNLQTSDDDMSGSGSKCDGVICPEISIWKICRDVAHGLQYMHGLGIVHCDIKPANIFFQLVPQHINNAASNLNESAINDVKYSVQCKIGDFGMSGPVHHPSNDEGDTTYMPVELLSCSTKHPSGDLFSLGMTLYEMASDPTWVVPREGRRWHSVRDSRHAVEVPSVRSIVLKDLIQRLIQPNAGMRPSADEVLRMCLSVSKTGCDEENKVCKKSEDYLQEEDFIVSYVQQVEKFEMQRALEIDAAHTAALEQRFTPTGALLREKGIVWLQQHPSASFLQSMDISKNRICESEEEEKEVT